MQDGVVLPFSAVVPERLSVNSFWPHVCYIHLRLKTTCRLHTGVPLCTRANADRAAQTHTPTDSLRVPDQESCIVSAERGALLIARACPTTLTLRQSLYAAL